MASRREYEMLFKLNASLGAGYTSAFTSAQAVLVNMQKEIDALSKKQGDISAYQKQQQAVEQTKQRLEALKEQYQNIKNEMSGAGEASSALKNKLIAKQSQIDRVSNSLNSQNQKLSEMGQRLQAAGIDTQNLTGESKRLAEELAVLKQRQEEAAQSAEKMGASATESFQAMAEIAATSGITETVEKLAEAYKKCVSVSVELESEMSSVEAISGASGDEMERLTNKAKELGATTKFTAQESAQAMTYMAMAGWSAEEMLSGMDGVMSLAAASGEDLSMVSDIVTDNLTAFGLKASDTARFADVLATAAANSNTNVAIMGETFKGAASVAGAMGYTIEEVATAVGLMANSGVKGTRAGTALKNMFNGLLEGCTLTGHAFGEYAFTAVKADGTMKGFTETLRELRTVFSQMTEAEKVSNANTIAGMRGYNGLLAIMNASEEEFEGLYSKMTAASGAAGKMADIKLDTAKGQIVLLQSAVEALQGTLGGLAKGELRSLAKAATDVVNGINKFVKEHPELVKRLLAFGATLGAVTVAVTGFAAAMTAAKAVAALVGTALGPVGIAVMAVGTALAVVAGAAAASNARLVDGTHTYAELTEAANEAQDTLKSTTETYTETCEKTNAAAVVADGYIGKLEELEEQGLESAEAQQDYHSYLLLLCQTVPELAQYIDLETNKINGGTAALRANTEEWKRNALAQAFQEKQTEIYKKYSDVLIEKEKNEAKLKAAQDALTDAQERYNAAYQKYTDISNGTLITDADDFVATEKAMRDAAAEVSSGTLKVKALTSACAEDSAALAVMDNELQDVVNAIKSVLGVTEELTGDAKILDGAMQTAAVDLNNLADAYNKAYDSAEGSIRGQLKLWDEAAKVAPTSIDTINKNIQGQAKYWENYNSNLAKLKGMAEQIDGLSDVISSFADGSADSVNAIAGLAKAADKSPEKLSKMVEGYTELKKRQGEASASIAEFATDFAEKTDKIVADFREDVKGLEFSEEAAKAAKETMQGYVDGATSTEPLVVEAFERLKATALAAIGAGQYAYQQSAYDQKVQQNTASWNKRHKAYASGTSSAERGFAVVGEEGPELVWMNGGERVLDARQTAVEARAAFGNATSNISVAFNIAGNAAAETVTQLREYADDFAERVLEVVRGENADMLRRAYA